MSQQEQDEIRQDYTESLQELTFNSAPIIKTLTVIAQENINYAQAITKALEDHLAKCPPAYKLPALYLLDSICKNVGSPYTAFFGLNIFKIFTDVYTSVTDPIRRKMFDLFRTWKEVPSTNGPLFSQEPMTKIDNFLAHARLKQTELERYQSGHRQPVAAAPVVPILNNNSLIEEVDKLIGLTSQRKRLEPNGVDAQRQLDILNQLKMVIPTLPPSNLPAIRSQLVTFRQKEIEILNKKLASMPQNRPVDLSQMLPFMGQSMPQMIPGFLPHVQNMQNMPNMPNMPPMPNIPNIPNMPSMPNMAPKASVQPASLAPAASNTGAPLLSMALINSLQSAGLLGKGLSATFEVELSNAELAKPRPDLIDMLHKSLPNQCGTCGKRFKNDENGKKQRQAHLDWHFRVNKKLREENRTQSRSWYLTLEEWVNFKDEDEILGWNRLNGSEPEEKKEDEAAPLTKEALEALQKKYIVIPPDKKRASLPCPICREKFESVWNDDAENWVWMNAVEEKNKVYHATCFEEMKRAVASNEKSKIVKPRVTKSTAPKKTLSELLPPSVDLNAILMKSKRKLEGTSDEPALKRERV